MSIKDCVIPIILSREVEDQIRYLCNQISREEWSGILFYEIIEGSIKEPATMKIELKDILPMNKGTQAYTEYDFGEPVVEYLMDNPHLMSTKIKLGHIHSHNSMATFFSGTDTSEIEDNSEFHNFYLSVITNNYLEFKAKIAFRGTVTNVVTAVDEEGENYNITFPEEKKVIFVYDCEVTNPHHATINPSFLQKVTTIIAEAAKRVTAVIKPYVAPNTYAPAGNPVQGFAPAIRQFDESDNYYKQSNFIPSMDSGIPDAHQKAATATPLEIATYEQQMEDFTMLLLLRGNKSEKFDTLSNLLKAFKHRLGKGKLKIDDLEKEVIEKYNDIYFSMFVREEVSDEVFVQDINQVCEILDAYTEDFQFLLRIVNALEHYGFLVERQLDMIAEGGQHGIN